MRITRKRNYEEPGVQVRNPDIEAHREWKNSQEYDKEPISRGEAYRRVLDDLFSSFTSLGCYPLIATDEQYNILCVNCARKVFLEERQEIFIDVYWEGIPMTCDECSEEIESAYGDPDEEQE